MSQAAISGAVKSISAVSFMLRQLTKGSPYPDSSDRNPLGRTRIKSIRLLFLMATPKNFGVSPPSETPQK